MESLLAMSGWILSGLLGLALLWLGIEWNRARMARNDLLRELYRHQQGVELILSFLEKGTQGTDPETFWEAFLESLRRLTRAGSGAVYLVENGLLQLERMAGSFPPPNSVSPEVSSRIQFNLLERVNYLKATPVPVDAPVCLASVVRTGKAEVVADTRSDPRFPESGQGTLRTDSYLALPLSYGEEVFGVVALAHKEGGGSFAQSDLTRSLPLVAQAALFYKLHWRTKPTESAVKPARTSAKPTSQSQLLAPSEALPMETPAPPRSAVAPRLEPQALEGPRPKASESSVAQKGALVLTDSLPRIKGFEVAAVNLSSGAIGGDFYDFIPVSARHWGIAIGDVCGKSVPASLLMTSCRALLRARATGVISPSEVLREVNHALYPEVPEDMFLTILYCVIDEETGEIRLARAGHELPLWYRGPGRPVELVRLPGLALGIDAGEIFNGEVQDLSFRLSSGELLFFYTDGLWAALELQGKDLGREALLKLVEKEAPRGPAVLLERLLTQMNQPPGEPSSLKEDVTLVAIQREA
jgi:sigma-B regulation protein RsbU (phosphoserine phosphatase)